MAEFEEAPCPVCRSSRHSLHLMAADRFGADLTPTFRLCRCLDCTMVFLNPRPVESDSAQYYQHPEYLPFSSTGGSGSLTERVYGRVRSFNLRWKRRLIRRSRGNHSPGSALDVGCGTGEFLGELRKRGWSVTGIERDRGAAEWARSTLGLEVVEADLQALDKRRGPFDLITLWHVLEHLYDPAGMLRSLHTLLADSGLLLIALPNVGGIDAALYQADWIAYDTPRHVSHFAPETLIRLMNENGFVLHARHQLPFDALFNTMMSESQAARRRRSSAIFWPLRLMRAAAISSLSLLGGSRIFAARYGASMVYLFAKR